MSMELLKRLSRQKLPLTISDPTEVEVVRVLRAADMVAAFLPAPTSVRSPTIRHLPAAVLAITTEGKSALKRWAEDQAAGQAHGPDLI